MSRILLIGENIALLQQCEKKLQELDYKVLIRKDVTDWVRDLFRPNIRCILWDVSADDNDNIPKYRMLRKHHKNTPIIIMDHNRERYGGILDFDTIFMNKNSSVEKIIHEIIDATSEASVLSDNDRIEMLEKEYGFME